MTIMCAKVQVPDNCETQHSIRFPFLVDFESGSVAINFVHNRIL